MVTSFFLLTSSNIRQIRQILEIARTFQQKVVEKRLTPHFFRLWMLSSKKHYLVHLVGSICWRHHILWSKFKNDVMWRHVTSRRHHDVKFSRNVSFISISLLSKYEVVWSIIYEVLAIYVFAYLIWDCIGNSHLPWRKISENVNGGWYGSQIWWKDVKRIGTKRTKCAGLPPAPIFHYFNFSNRGGRITPPLVRIGLRHF